MLTPTLQSSESVLDIIEGDPGIRASLFLYIQEFMRHRLTGLFFIAFPFLVSCSTENDREEARRAEYALQLTQEQYMQDNLPSSDSLIMVAVDWYERKGPERELALSYYYCGYINYQQGMGDKAAEFYSKALTHGEKSGDKTVLPMIYNEIGYMYKHQNDHEEAMTMFRKSADLLEEQGRYGMSFVPRYNEIEILNVSERYDEALEKVGNAVARAKEINDTSAILSLAGMKAAIVVNDTSRQAVPHEVLEELYDIYDRYNAGAVPESHYGTVGILLFLDNDLRTSRRYMEKAAGTSPDYLKVILEEYLSMLEEREGNPGEALRHERTASKLKDSIYEENKESLTEVIRTAEVKACIPGIRTYHDHTGFHCHIFLSIHALPT